MKQICFKWTNAFPMISFSEVLLIPAVGTPAVRIDTAGAGSHFHLRLVLMNLFLIQIQLIFK